MVKLSKEPQREDRCNEDSRYAGYQKGHPGAALVAQRFSAAFSPGRDPGDLGSSPMSGSLHEACFSLSLPVSLPLSLWVSHE